MFKRVNDFVNSTNVAKTPCMLSKRTFAAVFGLMAVLLIPEK